MKTGSKILIMGGSCAGKSTLSDKLGQKLKLPVLHLDLYDPHAFPDGPERVARKKEIKSVISKTIKKQKWIIEGIYEWFFLEERFNSADTLILLYQPVYKRVYRYIKSCVFRIKRHGRNGFSAKNFRWDHIWFMLRKKDAPYQIIQQMAKQHKKLQVITLKSFKDIDKFVENIKLNSK